MSRSFVTITVLIAVVNAYYLGVARSFTVDIACIVVEKLNVCWGGWGGVIRVIVRGVFPLWKEFSVVTVFRLFSEVQSLQYIPASSLVPKR